MADTESEAKSVSDEELEVLYCYVHKSFVFTQLGVDIRYIYNIYI